MQHGTRDGDPHLRVFTAATDKRLAINDEAVITGAGCAPQHADELACRDIRQAAFASATVTEVKASVA